MQHPAFPSGVGSGPGAAMRQEIQAEKGKDRGRLNVRLSPSHVSVPKHL